MAGPRVPFEHPVSNDDHIIIAVMGETGSGKSEFVGRITGQPTHVNHLLRPEGRGICPYTFRLAFPNAQPSRNVRLIDCPGFDDPSMPDRHIIRSILQYLQGNYREGQKLHGIIYMIPINRNRMTGRSLAHLSVFRELCGTGFYPNVVLATTFWDVLPNEAVGIATEYDLTTKQHFWGEMQAKGSKVVRIGRNVGSVLFPRNTASENDLQIIRDIADRHEPKWLRAQREMASGIDELGTSVIRESDAWRDHFQRRFEEVRRRFQQEIDRRHVDLQQQRGDRSRLMNEELQHEETLFAEDQSRFQNRARDLRREMRAQRQAGDDTGARVSQENVRRLTHERNQRQELVQQAEQDDLAEVLRNCTHRRGAWTGSRIRCSKPSCPRIIDPSRDSYYHCCFCKMDRFYHCEPCGASCPKKSRARIPHPRMPLLHPQSV